MAQAKEMGRYEEAEWVLDCLDRNSGYLSYLEIEMDEKAEEEGLSEHEEVLLDVIDEWDHGVRDPDVSLLKRWLQYKQYEEYLPTVENDLSRHMRCLGCGASKYVTDKHGCGCPVGGRDSTYYDCLDCGEEYTGREKVNGVPLCPDCFKDAIGKAKRSENN